jgi:hypothetical protein
MTRPRLLRKTFCGGAAYTEPGRTLTIMPTSPGALGDSLTALWEHIRADHSELPPARITAVPTAPAADHGPERWSLVDGYLHGLVVSTKTLGLGVGETVDSLLHDAAHVLCWRRGRRDTTSRGYYHTAEYRQAAEEIGLEWPEDEPRSAGRGYADMRVPADLRKHFEAVATDLESAVPEAMPAITALRKRDKTSTRPSFQCRCDPPRRIWVAQSTMDLGAIDCGICGQAFT